MFQSMGSDRVERNVISYNAVINACAVSGQWEKSVKLFTSMKDTDIKPNAITYNSVMKACSVGRQVSNFNNVFESKF